jgi:hypothetical protein
MEGLEWCEGLSTTTIPARQSKVARQNTIMACHQARLRLPQNKGLKQEKGLSTTTIPKHTLQAAPKTKNSL